MRPRNARQRQEAAQVCERWGINYTPALTCTGAHIPAPEPAPVASAADITAIQDREATEYLARCNSDTDSDTEAREDGNRSLDTSDSERERFGSHSPGWKTMLNTLPESAFDLSSSSEGDLELNLPNEVMDRTIAELNSAASLPSASNGASNLSSASNGASNLPSASNGASNLTSASNGASNLPSASNGASNLSSGSNGASNLFRGLNSEYNIAMYENPVSEIYLRRAPQVSRSNGASNLLSGSNGVSSTTSSTSNSDVDRSDAYNDLAALDRLVEQALENIEDQFLK
jgi:hypothetical protein